MLGQDFGENLNQRVQVGGVFGKIFSQAHEQFLHPFAIGCADYRYSVQIEDDQSLDFFDANAATRWSFATH